MPIRIYKPTSPGRRFSSVDTFEDITKKEPEKSLIVMIHKKAGRTKGRITVRHRGGGTKRYYRKIDFKRNRYDEPAKVLTIEYDPNRGARIALIQYPDGERRYVLAPVGLGVGESVASFKAAGEFKTGNRMPLRYIPPGTSVYNIEVEPGKGGQLVRGAGLSAQLMAFVDKYAQLKMPSGEIRLVQSAAAATIGQLSNPDRRLIRWGKAGRTRHRRFRPTVRGKAMNPVDHPHGGGEGRNPIGLLGGPKNLWGKLALGVKTRKKKKWSNKLIIKRRK